MRSCKSIDWSNLAKLKVSTQQAGGPSKIMGTSFHSSRVRVGETKHFVKPNPEIQKNNMKKSLTLLKLSSLNISQRGQTDPA